MKNVDAVKILVFEKCVENTVDLDGDHCYCGPLLMWAVKKTNAELVSATGVARSPKRTIERQIYGGNVSF